MNRPTDDIPVYPLGRRKAVMIAYAVPFIAALTAILIHHKGLVNVEDFGLPEEYLYAVGFAVMVAAFVVLLFAWRCPRCRSYLGREASPASCPKCGALFR